MYHGLPVQSGIPVRFRSALVPFRLVYGRLPVAVAVVVDKESPLAGSMAAVGKDALLLPCGMSAPCTIGLFGAGGLYVPFVPYA